MKISLHAGECLKAQTSGIGLRPEAPSVEHTKILGVDVAWIGLAVADFSIVLYVSTDRGIQ